MLPVNRKTPNLRNFKLCFAAIESNRYALEIGASGHATAMLAERFREVVVVEPCIQPGFYQTTAGYRNITTLPGRLVECIGPLSRHSQFDFIYVGSSRLAQEVLLDLTIAWSLLKAGGTMLIDNYEWEPDESTQENLSPKLTGAISPSRRQELLSPRAAVDGFIRANAEAEPLFIGYQVVLRRRFDLREHINTRRIA